MARLIDLSLGHQSGLYVLLGSVFLAAPHLSSMPAIEDF